METFAVEHGVSSVGYALVEETRPGRFDVDTADRLGVPDGPARGLLQHGERVTLADGRVVAPDDVLGPPRDGRKLVLTGDTAPAASVVEAAAGADVLVHEATFLAGERDRARETMHSTAGEAALVAREAGVKLLALTHVSTRYFGHEVVAEARGALPRDRRPTRLRRHSDPLPGARCTGARSRRCPGRPSSCDRVPGAVTKLVQVAVAGDVAEAELLQELLSAVGIESQLEPAVEHDPQALDDPPLKVFVSESAVDDAREAIEAQTALDDDLEDV